MSAKARVLANRRFDATDQDRFAALSGDFNPMHVDHDVARRLVFGQRVVHGMHAVIACLESLLDDVEIGGDLARRGLGRIAASFNKPIFVGEAVKIRLLSVDEGMVHVQLSAGHETLVDLRVWLGQPIPVLTPTASWSRPERREPRQWSVDLAGQRGAFDLRLDRELAALVFPRCIACLGILPIATLASLSWLVGMECPGHDSIFSSFDLIFTEAAREVSMTYVVRRAGPEFPVVDLTIEGAGARGSIKVFRRPASVAQPEMRQLAERVAPKAFAGQRALIVGGSRGLGEATAKLIACGGGLPVVTFAHGQADAQRVVDDIVSWGGTAQKIAFDVSRPAAAIRALRAGGTQPTHLYYFASPKIFLRKSEFFVQTVFNEFLRYYVNGFLTTVRSCRAATDAPLRAFYPSTVALDEPVRQLTEYACAKAAGEAMCRQLETFDRGLSVTVRRLPRVATDQTTTVVRVPAAAAAEVMLPILREMAGSAQDGVSSVGADDEP